MIRPTGIRLLYQHGLRLLLMEKLISGAPIQGFQYYPTNGMPHRFYEAESVYIALHKACALDVEGFSWGVRARNIAG